MRRSKRRSKRRSDNQTVEEIDWDLEIKRYVEKFKELYREDVEKASLHLEYYQENDKSYKAWQWRYYINRFVEIHRDEIMNEVQEKKMPKESGFKLWMQIKSATKERNQKETKKMRKQ